MDHRELAAITDRLLMEASRQWGAWQLVESLRAPSAAERRAAYRRYQRAWAAYRRYQRAWAAYLAAARAEAAEAVEAVAGRVGV